ncbi:hypothetical protein NKH77_51230 [Streptomyces sp. M19]
MPARRSCSSTTTARRGPEQDRAAANGAHDQAGFTEVDRLRSFTRRPRVAAGSASGSASIPARG